MSGADDGDNSLPPAPSGPAARFGPHPETNINVQVNAQNLHINPSNLSALERIVQLDPAVAGQIVKASSEAVRYERDRYNVGAIATASACIVTVICAAAVTIFSGFLSGIAFFLVCVAIAAIASAIFTGKTQDLSWTVGMLPGGNRQKEPSPDKPLDV
ncbi:hypothetical protein [Methylorubrum populi]|uniref:hypothetical protein n=1 Tax=Methylorubrum populi TaxID=223967 RepID=UPI0012657B7D|nr:hypothetical protein [Methylorubrum populi]